MYKIYDHHNKDSEDLYYFTWINQPTTENIENLYQLLGLKNIQTISQIPETDRIIYGYRLNFETPWSSTVKRIAESVELNNLERIEKFRVVSTKKWEEIEKDFDYLQMKVYYSDLESWYDQEVLDPLYQQIFSIKNNEFELYNQKYGLGFDQSDLEFYKNLFPTGLTNLELYDLGQSNSEHSRHWTFNSKIILDGIEEPETMFQLVKKPYKVNPNNSLIAFCDNSSAIEGFNINDYDSNKIKKIHFCLTAETHNFPTGICPFPGSATGVGGRIRDTIATGKGAKMIAGTAGYCVGKFRDSYSGQMNDQEKRSLNILVQASNGASDYGNKIGEPIILGFTRSYTSPNHKLTWKKPIMFSGGIGHIEDKDLKKDPVKENLLIVRVGGKTYRIGLGGGSASSRDQRSDLDYQAVQRGDPEMENRVVRFISRCIDLPKNPIISLHDQGAGGMANVTKEIVSPVGGYIDLNKVKKGDATLSPLETWLSESQEQLTFLIDPIDLTQLKIIAKEEKLELEVVGKTEKTGQLEVRSDNQIVGNFDLKKVLEELPQKTMNIQSGLPIQINPKKTEELLNYNFPDLPLVVIKILKNLTVGSKSFLTNKVDRSVSGLIVQQQTIGKYQIPISDYALTATSYYPCPDTGLYTGTVLSIGEQPLKGINYPKRMVEMTFGEMMLNMIGVCLLSSEENKNDDPIGRIKISGNWMWSPKIKPYDYTLYSAVKRLSEICLEFGCAIDGGKDSLSMNSGDKISPPTLVLSSYAPVPNIECRVNSGLIERDSYLVLIDFSNGQTRLGGSILVEEYLEGEGLELSEDEYPRMDNPEAFKKVWVLVQKMIKDGYILSAHDRSDGGLMTTLIEMSLANYVGLNLKLNQKDLIRYLFNEELGLVLQITKDLEYQKLLEILMIDGIKIDYLGETIKEEKIWLFNGETKEYLINLNRLHDYWNHKSYQIEKHQANPEIIKNEYEGTKFSLNEYVLPSQWFITNWETSIFKLRAILLRETGSNGDREMEAVLKTVGFEVDNRQTDDLIKQPNLMNYHLLVMVGGFSNSDVLGSARGWAEKIKNNSVLYDQFNQFFKDQNKYSLGVCNGFQLMTHLGCFGNVKLEENLSERFESRWVNIKVKSFGRELLNNMNGLEWGCWCAHHEGRIKLNDQNKNVRVLTYAQKEYPGNPNGSDQNIAGLLSFNGHHLGMMPHPERSYLIWQNPWISEGMKKTLKKNDSYIRYSPWFRLFQNYYKLISIQKEVRKTS